LLSEKTRKICERISKDIKYVELSSRADFQEEFVKAMFFNFIT